MKHIKIITISILIILLSIFVSFKYYDDIDDFNIVKNLDIYHSVIRDARIYYVDETDYAKLIKESIDDMLKKLDPYTVVFPESMVEDYRFMSTGAYGGIGAVVIEKNGKLIITEIYDNSPAQIAKLQIGDIVTGIAGEKITKSNLKDLKDKLDGESGTKIDLEIERYNLDNKINISVKRDYIEMKNVEYSEILENDIAYIKLKYFHRGAFNDFKNAFIQLSDLANLQGLIIDLRGNPGGFLVEATNIVNLFVEKGSVIVSTKGKMKKWNKVHKANSNPINTEIPITVLVDNSSASASEIVSGAIQDLDRGVVIGQRTYGKGLVQTTRDLSYNTKFKITTAKYYIPSGRCIQAIDYTHRKKDGSVGNVPDSMISEFTTAKGRKVYDGGGINPDIIVKKQDFSPLIFGLIKDMMIFDYATKFHSENKTISSPKDFKLNNAQYTDFINYVKKHNFSYTTGSANMVKDLKEIAISEKYDDSTINQIEQLKNSLEPNIDDDFKTFKNDIISIINQEICLRYYSLEGQIISSFEHDENIIKAKQLIMNKNEYDSILGNM